MKIDRKKFFQMKNQYITRNKKNVSKILINFIKIQKLTLTLKTSLHRSRSYRGSFQIQRKLDLLTAQARLSLKKRPSAQRVL